MIQYLEGKKGSAIIIVIKEKFIFEFFDMEIKPFWRDRSVQETTLLEMRKVWMKQCLYN